MVIELIRHGQTAGNLKKQYIGRTDEDLASEGAKNIAAQYDNMEPADILWVSPMKRCLETACIISGLSEETVMEKVGSGADRDVFIRALEQIYGDRIFRVVEDFKECDFGLFEGKSWIELSGDTLYQKWIDSNGEDPFPQGEIPDQFRERCAHAFEHEMRSLFSDENTTAGDMKLRIVAHGGTIMSIMDRFAVKTEDKKGYYDWQIKNGEMVSTYWDASFPIVLSDAKIIKLDNKGNL